MKHRSTGRKMASTMLPLATAAALLLMLSACAQRAARDEPDSSGAQAAPATQVQKPVPPAADTAAADAETPADAPPAAAPSAPPVTQGKPYAFVCVPYDDRPKPPPRKTVHKDTPQTAPAPSAPVSSATDQKPSSSAVISILGKKVFGRDGEDMGRVVDVLADSDGHARAAVIDFGGFLGVGNRRVAVDWRSLQIDPSNADKPVILSLSRDQVNAAPEFKESAHPEQAIVTDHAANTPAAPPHPQ